MPARHRVLAALATLLCCVVSGLQTPFTDPRFLVLPPPRMVHAKEGAWLPYHLAANFTVALHPSTAAAAAASSRLARTVARYGAILLKAAREDYLVGSPASDRAITSVSLFVGSGVGAEDVPRLDTDYSYTMTLLHGSPVVTITAPTVYGAAYALESLAQLFFSAADGPSGVRLPSQLMLHDAPALPWRGIMLDAGRRFFPVPLVENFLDTMAAAKLNVLHWHLSDECRWGVQSALFPNLTAALSGQLGGFYTQADVAAVVAYAADRGIRVVPEFDVVGHT